MTVSIADALALLPQIQAQTGSRDLEKFLRGLLNGEFLPASGMVTVSDADTTILATDSGKPHLVSNVSADRTITLPAPAEGLEYEFIANAVVADGHDWIFTTGSNTNYFTGGIVHLDTDSDAAGDEIVSVRPDGNSNSVLQINLPDVSTRVRFVCDGTLWNVSGIAVSATAPAFSD